MSRNQREETRQTGTGRSKRIPLGRARIKGDASRYQKPGKEMRWFNDDPGRLQDAEEAGWAYVVDSTIVLGEGPVNERDQTSTKVRQRRGTQKDGSALMGYLMEIDTDLAQEDRQAKEEDRLDKENAMRRGKGEDGGMGKDGRYIPEEGIRIEHGHGNQSQ